MKILYDLKFDFLLHQITQNGPNSWNKCFLGYSIFFHFVVTRLPELSFFDHFSKKVLLAGWICMILYILIVLIFLDHLTATKCLPGWHNYAKWDYICVKVSIFDKFFHFCENTILTELMDHPKNLRVILMLI